MNTGPYLITGSRLAEQMARENARANALSVWAIIIVGCLALTGIVLAAAWSSDRANAARSTERRI